MICQHPSRATVHVFAARVVSREFKPPIARERHAEYARARRREAQHGAIDVRLRSHGYGT
ncbi:predicted protein [Ostreococcus lucimarinus CCE9901]|uniref:Uncharacterized protein n=1 Tax=Ostreococcus lucimarinus (strain CCE9901) TaxID=436017 RepID=A4S218_OSTLU|nr:predicted protein [Ostreococcus lucimarinus CCE9901]ABO97542.1 predicted protein [Ostreococcus lucimarinus CCE9901]|eukprot:XP_001419249.1 predicted protein [Ostreococcus lucimarinus CCE9901]